MEEQGNPTGRVSGSWVVTDLRRHESHVGRDTGVLASSKGLRFGKTRMHIRPPSIGMVRRCVARPPLNSVTPMLNSARPGIAPRVTVAPSPSQ